MMTTDSQRLKIELLAAAQEATADRTPIQTGRDSSPGQSASVSGVVWSGLVLLGVIAIYLLAARPEWVYPPTAAAAATETPELADASIRLALVRERQRVVQFQEQHGRLPTSAAEAGVTLPGVELVTGPAGGFQLRTRSGTASIALSSTDQLETFLGNSLEVILARRGTR